MSGRSSYLGQKWQSIDDHYHFSDGHLSTVKGYESYGKMARTYAKIGESAETRKKATDFYVSIQIVGTPEDCLDKIAELQRADRARPSRHRVLVRRACRTRRPR